MPIEILDILGFGSDLGGRARTRARIRLSTSEPGHVSDTTRLENRAG